MGEIALERLECIIEALLFVAGEAVSLERLQKIIPEAERGQLLRALERLKARYQGRGVVLKEVAEGFRLETDPSLAPYIQRLLYGAPPKLSRAALETLAIIAYKQPITKAEIEALRGVDSSGALKALLEKDLVRVAGRKDLPGKPLLYATTRRFLEVFGLKDLKELPSLKELEEWVTDASS
jgi:segregation and condensation protein B